MPTNISVEERDVSTYSSRPRFAGCLSRRGIPGWLVETQTTSHCPFRFPCAAAPSMTTPDCKTFATISSLARHFAVTKLINSNDMLTFL
ncbi:hypothetical protein KIN20_007651 [Parelaphostrongylus tenuis]|uniref:Uncharacterized protein n=1 Tax=Parelaphostrongylus tenuis TaxID=148309 RepID=A0AAD5M5R9_PARTN|nr:hypothetical protein KIN20_007651 [Parelaphostrongylus tenuis]